MAQQTIKDLVLELAGTGLDNEAIAEAVKAAFPGAKTTPATVSSIKSVARRNGEGVEVQTIDLGGGNSPQDLPADADTGETDEEVRARLDKRFKTLERMTQAVLDGVLPSLIVSGPAGLGKSYGIERAIEARQNEDDTFHADLISGTITAVGLYIALWHARDGGVVVLDDCDDVFRDETTLNILKAALDSSDRRVISWRKRSSWLEEEGIDDRFEFNGKVIFLTNLDFERAVQTGKPGAVHFKALMDRSLYLDLTLKTMRDYMTRISQVVMEHGMLRHGHNLSDEVATEILAFVEANKTRFYHLSLRLVHQIAICYRADKANWQDDVEATKMRVGR